MADIVNLRTVRKRKVREERDAVAAQNRILFGRTKAEKQHQEREAARAGKHIDGHRRDDGEPS